MDEYDAGYLERAWHLAENGRGSTSPNPVVGAVIVKDGEVIGEGWHVGPGRDHAEVAAIRDAVLRRGGGSVVEGPVPAEAARRACAGTTMYVTLEPCCTHGRTPPCTSALIDAGFARVVAGAVDPTPQIDGRGFSILRAAGMQVEVAGGDLSRRMRRQNDGWRKAVVSGLPFVTYKCAMTLDGRLAADSGDSRWISSTESRSLVHIWRAWADAVVVGAGTARTDDPRLTARGVAGARQPLRVVVGGEAALAKTSQLVKTLDDGPVLLLCGAGLDSARRAEVESWGVQTEEVTRDQSGRIDPVEACRILAAREVRDVLLEGGPTLAGAWWSAGVVDKLAFFVCPKVVSGMAPAGALRGLGSPTMDDVPVLREVEVQQVGPDLLVSGYMGEPF